MPETRKRKRLAIVTAEELAKEAAQRAADLLSRARHEALLRSGHLDELRCEFCNTFLCWVYECDDVYSLNSSSFICGSCHTQPPRLKETLL